jgi:hypothetical protein
MAWYDARLKLFEDGCEDWECDGLDGFAILFTMEFLDSSYKSTNDGGFAGCEGEVGVSVQGANSGEVGFDGFGLNTSSEVSNP